ncbi:hypothetical protein C8A03DRAFT_48199 [Achaetomium macrosporum]|uniref:Uncharacterized protein n=1 Tax=Achaetomium macrosporum TaxID=79813 RepID=A0AAN7C0S5_9PEZI|nr:hypothetical protein C8A03DRAFT_48199 [Achaetomium macrosporum]
MMVNACVPFSLMVPVAKQTFAQIVDGLPLSSVAYDTYDGCVFDANTLLVDAKLLRDYQAAPVGSTAEFTTQLVELVARAIHQIAVWFYKQNTNRHKDDSLSRWRPSETYAPFYPATFHTTLFCHPWYRDYDQYPEGIGDCVGYWAEARIFGGVVLLDRRDPESTPDAEPDAIYLRPDRSGVIYRIYRLLDSQTEELSRFLLSDTTPPQHCPLPLLPSEANRQRVDPEEDIEITGIHRDPWERRPRQYGEPRFRDRRLKDVVDTFNYLSYEDWGAARGQKGTEKEERKAQKGKEAKLSPSHPTIFCLNKP